MIVTLHQPKKLVFGAGCVDQCVADLKARAFQRVMVLTAPHAIESTRAMFDGVAKVVRYDASIRVEPNVATFDMLLKAARDLRPEAVVGIGGGSVLDVAKLVAALMTGEQKLRDVFGINKLAGRSVYLACLPTTAGTGSEVSPNAILLDEHDDLKKGVISPHLVPDAAYIDPALTLSVPAAVTAATGIDALTHCIEAFVNKLSHPMVDTWAIEGVSLIAANLQQAVEQGDDLPARTAVAMGSLYGGLCLGPVNTGAVHALAYPLGGEFHVPHGVSNSVLLPHVLEFNVPAAPEKYARVAIAMGAKPSDDPLATARRGLDLIRDLSKRCGIPKHLRELNIPRDAIPRMAKAAMTVTRLLDRNVRAVTEADAISIYEKAY